MVKLYSKFFEISQRSNGQDYTTLKNEAPQNLVDFVQHVHTKVFFDCFPNDWIYDEIHTAFDVIETESHGGPVSENMLDEMKSQTEGDDYNTDLLEWFKWPFAQEFGKEVVEEGLCECDVFDIISTAQREAIKRIMDEVNSFLKNQDK